METIQEAKTRMRAEMRKGVACPCCNQFVKLYKRKLNSGMAITLIRLFRHYGISKDFVNVKDFLRENKYSNSHDWTLLKHWGFIEEEKTDPSQDAKSSGRWRITLKGEEFVLGILRAPSHILTYNSGFYGFEGDSIVDMIGIEQAIGNKFSYLELMNNNV